MPDQDYTLTEFEQTGYLWQFQGEIVDPSFTGAKLNITSTGTPVQVSLGVLSLGPTPITGYQIFGDSNNFVLTPTAGPTDTSLPVVENIQPAPGTTLAVSQTLQFDVIDDSGDFRRIIVMTKMLSQNAFEVVHDGANFGPKYQDPSNTRVAILDGYRYTVKRDGGWFKGFTLTLVPVAIDQSGNENIQT